MNSIERETLQELLPWLYLKGISTGDFHEALAALLGPNAAGLSLTTISRLKANCRDEYNRWQRRDFSTRCAVSDGRVISFDRIGVIRGRFPSFRAVSSYGVPALMEDQAVEIVGEVREGEIRLGTSQTDCTDKQAEAVFLVGEHVLYPCPD